MHECKTVYLYVLSISKRWPRKSEPLPPVWRERLARRSALIRGVRPHFLVSPRDPSVLNMPVQSFLRARIRRKASDQLPSPRTAAAASAGRREHFPLCRDGEGFAAVRIVPAVRKRVGKFFREVGGPCFHRPKVLRRGFLYPHLYAAVSPLFVRMNVQVSDPVSWFRLTRRSALLILR
jgi:hypothetical protein